MEKMKVAYFLILPAIIFYGCLVHSNQKHFTLPLDKKTEWTYEVRGYIGYSLKNIKPPKLHYESRKKDSADIISSNLPNPNVGIESTFTNLDTIIVYLEEIESFENSSIRFEYNIDFVRYWGKEILRTADGYQLLFNTSEAHYLLRFPISLGRQWSNKYTFVSEECFISAIDTTINKGGKDYKNCIEITVFRSDEGMKSTIKIYLNEEDGLVYYKDSSNQDELRLIKKVKRRNN